MAGDYEDRDRRAPYHREPGFADRAGDTTPSWLRDDEAERRHERAWRDERWESPDRGRPDRDHEARRRGYGGDTGHDTSWSGPSSGAYGQGQYGSRGVPWNDTGWDRGNWRQEGPFAGRGPKGYQRSDSRIRDDVSDRLTDAPDIDATEIEVNVNNGEVTLAGTVRNRHEKRRSEDLTEGVTGVRDVHNNLRVSHGQEGPGSTQ